MVGVVSLNQLCFKFLEPARITNRSILYWAVSFIGLRITIPQLKIWKQGKALWRSALPILFIHSHKKYILGE
jgi:hypothetical protein